MPLNKMPTETAPERKRAFEVHYHPPPSGPEGRSLNRLRRQVTQEPVSFPVCDGQAGTVDGNRFTGLQFSPNRPGLDPEHAAFRLPPQGAYPPDLFDDSSKQVPASPGAWTGPASNSDSGHTGVKDKRAQRETAESALSRLILTPTANPEISMPALFGSRYILSK